MGPVDHQILTTNQDYQGVVNSLRYDYTRTGAEVITVSLPWPTLEAKRVVEAVLGPPVRLSVFDHISSNGAVVMPIKRLVELCCEHDIPVFVDGAHATGIIALDITDVDRLASAVD